MTGAPTPPTRGPFSGVADQAAAYCAGQRDGQHLVHQLRAGHSPADALADALGQVQATATPARLRGFLRAVQRAIEAPGRAD